MTIIHNDGLLEKAVSATSYRQTIGYGRLIKKTVSLVSLAI